MSDQATGDVPSHVVVTGAGTPEVNGVYIRDGFFSMAYKYYKWAVWNGMQCKFTIFQCTVRDNTRHWYISIVPDGAKPGTMKDTDFYSAASSTSTAPQGTSPLPPVTSWVPPTGGWGHHKLMGQAPPPTLWLGQGPLPALSHPYPYMHPYPYPTMWPPPVIGDVGSATNAHMLHGPNAGVAAATPPVAAVMVAAPKAVSEQRNNESIIQKLETQKSEWVKELEILTKEKQTLKENNEKLIATNKRQQDEIENLTKQAWVEKNQALEKDLSKRMAQNKQQQVLMEDLIKKRDKVESNLKAEIASLRKTIASFKRQGKQQTKSDNKALQEKEEAEEEGNPSSKNDGPFQILVQGAGAHEVNGTYSQDGYSEKACRYSKVGKYKGKNCKFYMLLCQTDDKTKHWYITIVPDGFSPGTTNDIDFYFAQVTSSCRRIPPLKGWDYANKGRFPPPTIAYHNNNNNNKNENKISPKAGKASKSPAQTEGTVEQRDHHESEISSLRAAVADLDRKNDELRMENYKLLLEKIAHYEQKEHEQLRESNKALREKVTRYEQQEKAKMSILEHATRCEEPETTRALKSIRKDPEEVHLSPPGNAKRARHDETTCDNSEEKDASKGLLVV